MRSVISPVHFPRYRFPARAAAGGLFDGAYFFRRGTWALAHGLRAIARMRDVQRLRVLVPAYMCREPLDALRALPIDWAYYDVDARGVPQWEDVHTLARRTPFHVLLLVHYFGFPNDLATARTLCAAYSAELVEDCAHVLEPFGGVGTTGTCSVWSPWKFYPVPELGVLHAADQLRPFVEVLSARRDVAACARWHAKRELQRALCAMGVNWYRRERMQQRNGVPPGDAVPSSVSVRIVRSLCGDAPQMAHARRARYAALERAVHGVRPDAVFLRLGDHPASTPYVFPFLAPQPARAVARRLAQAGIPAFPWPELPHAVREAARYPGAHWLAERIVLLPVHEQVGQRQLAAMCRALPSVLAPVW